MKAVKIFSGIVAILLMYAFAGGLAHSIYQRTESIAFVVIVGLVLAMVTVDAIQGIREKDSEDH